MANSSKILKIRNGKFYFTRDEFVDIRNTNIPPGSLKFKRAEPINWEVEILNYDSKSETARLKVLDYNPDNVASFQQQSLKRSVKHFQFETFEWTKLEPQLSSYRIHLLRDILNVPPSFKEETSHKRSKHFFETPREDSNYHFDDVPNYSNIDSHKDDVQEIQEEFSYPFNSAIFRDGYVSVTYKPKSCSKQEGIDIFNEHILSQFHYIRNYFPKHFKKGKKFTVQLKGEVQHQKLIKYKAFSQEIEAINKDVISRVYDLVNVGIFDSHAPAAQDHQIKTLEDVQKSADLSKEVKNILSGAPHEILSAILRTNNVKNRKQLEYLSGLKQQANHPLRFTLKPLFGFVFCVEGAVKKHFCWELLNSHATYIWSFNSRFDFAEQLNQLEKILSFIKLNGRKTYREQEKMNNGSPFLFSTIYHKDRLSESDDAFVSWKKDFEEKMNK